MTYISWGLYVEGPTDAGYLNVLIPRLISHLLRESAGPLATIPDLPAHTFGMPRSDLAEIAAKVCEGRSAFHILFVHGDTGGRALAEQLRCRTCALCERIESACAFPRVRCVVAAPNRETEAWTLADIASIRRVFGIVQDAELEGIPSKPTQVERLEDPKQVTQNFLKTFQGGPRRKRPRWPFENIAQEQDIELLLQVPSFRSFAEALRQALRTLGHVDI